MCRFIETLKIQNAKAINIELHNERLNSTRRHFFGKLTDINLREYFSRISEVDISKTYRCTFEYSQEIEDVRLLEYNTPSVKSLKVVEDNQIDYAFKNADRSALDLLYNKRENCDNIIIVKNGLISDSWYANLAFYDGELWFTPENPLLKGTKRSLLISQNLIQEQEIRLKDIPDFQKVCLINAMLDLDQCTVDINAVKL